MALLVLGLTTRVSAAPICTADAIACPPGATCVITGTVDVEDGCVLDFGPRCVELRGTIRSAEVGGSFELLAACLTIAGGRLRAPGDGDEAGGSITVEVGADFTMTGTGALVDVGGGGGGGSFDVTAASISVLAGAVDANGGGGEDCDDGGSISLATEGALVVDGVLRATTPNGSLCSGGAIVLEGATVTVRDSVDVSSGGSSSGAIGVVAAGGGLLVEASGSLAARGRGSVDGSGVAGGEITLEASEGNLRLDGVIEASGSAPDGTGGTVGITAAQDISVMGTIDAGGSGGGSDGGSIALDGGREIAIAGDVSVAGGGAAQGGTIDAIAGSLLNIAPAADVNASGGNGGWIDLLACTLTVDGTLGARAGASGEGGTISLRGGNVTIAASAAIDDCPCTISPCVEVTVPTASSSSIDPGAGICPPPVVEVDEEFAPCCGDGEVDDAIGEECDDGGTSYCDGCSPRCKIELPDPCADDGNPCTATTCNPSVGCEPLTGTACPDDGNPCTEDVCVNGACTHPSPCAEPGSDPCRVGSCDPVLGCQFEDLPDGTACQVEGCAASCSAGECVNPCDDGNPCTVDDCFESICLSLEDPALCPCSDDGGPAAAGTPCADGSNCTSGDVCDGEGSCAGVPGCDDGDPCTVDFCGGFLCAHSDQLCPRSCAGLLDGTPCSDGSPCTTGYCQGETCIAEPCGGGDSCDGAWTCSPIYGCFRDPAPDTCADDGNPCTADLCDASGACVHEPLSGTACPDDGVACTADVCNAGTCEHPAQSCDDGDVCTSDSCDPTAGCRSEPLDCDDGDACTLDSCAPATGCTHTTVDCDDGDPCTLDACDAAGGCTHVSTCGLDHFQCYRAAVTPGTPRFTPVIGISLEDELGPATVDIRKPLDLCTPASKNGEDPSAPDHEDHLGGYRIRASAGSSAFTRRTGIVVTNQLGTLQVDVLARDRLLVPSVTSLNGPPAPSTPPDPDHFECYRVKTTRGAPRFAPIPNITLQDQFGLTSVEVRKPTALCNPANKRGEDPSAPSHPGHLLCYQTKPSPGSARFSRRSVLVSNQLGTQSFDLVAARELCVPSTVTGP